MKSRFAASILAALLAVGVMAQAQRSTPQPRRGTAETRLVGISLFDTGAKVITVYGSPDEVQALNIGGGGGAPQGGPQGAPGGFGAPGAGGPPGRGGGGGGPALGAPSANSATPNFGIPIDNNQAMPGFLGDPFGVTQNRQFGPPQGPPGSSFGPPSGFTPPGGGGGGRGDDEGLDGGDPAGGGPGGIGGAQQATRTIYTRWVYNRGGSRYGFVLDKFNRVVQIEAIGMKDSKVRTRRGMAFGSSFGSIIKSYGAPDGYEIAGSNIVMRYLVLDRVAFRLSKLTLNGKHCVTGVVVAAGKT